MAKDIIDEGRKLAKKGNCPLMYEWHGKKYWGAAHGLAGIMHVLMHTELKLDEKDDVKNTLLYMIRNRYPTGNYPSSEGSESDRLVHWCHGAPGVALTLAKAYQVTAYITSLKCVHMFIQSIYVYLSWWLCNMHTWCSFVFCINKNVSDLTSCENLG